MKSIEERAKEWVEHIAKSRPYVRVDVKIYHTSEVSGLIDIMVMSYIAGANEQKEIDNALLLKLKSSWEEEAQINHNDESNYKQGYHDAIEEACEWFSDYLFEIGNHDDWERDRDNTMSGEKRFRKAMEE